jgi:hypothetical protein
MRKIIRNLPILSGLFFCLVLTLVMPSSASDGKKLLLKRQAPKYYIYPEYLGICPDQETTIRCYHYHWDWICEKGDTLYWDRRLETAAYEACGCALPDDIAPASSFKSKKPRKGIFSPLDTH